METFKAPKNMLKGWLSVSRRRHRSPQRALLTLGPWSPWSPCKQENNSRKWRLWLRHSGETGSKYKLHEGGSCSKVHLCTEEIQLSSFIVCRRLEDLHLDLLSTVKDPRLKPIIIPVLTDAIFCSHRILLFAVI